jgi:hypothetical protein
VRLEQRKGFCAILLNIFTTRLARAWLEVFQQVRRLELLQVKQAEGVMPD